MFRPCCLARQIHLRYSLRVRSIREWRARKAALPFRASSAELFSRSTVRPPKTKKSRGPTERVRATTLAKSSRALRARRRARELEPSAQRGKRGVTCYEGLELATADTAAAGSDYRVADPGSTLLRSVRRAPPRKIVIAMFCEVL